MPRGKIKYCKKDKEWAKIVKRRDGNKCVICGQTERLNAHHIIPREIKITKHDPNNGISLCPSHHRFNRQLSAHQNPLAFIIWMANHRAQQLNYLSNIIENDYRS